MKTMKIAIISGNDFKDYDSVNKLIDDYLNDLFERKIITSPSQVVFVSGGLSGDCKSLSNRYSSEEGYGVAEFPSKDKEKMFEYIKESIVGVLFVIWDGENKDVKDIIAQGHHYGLEVHTIRYNKGDKS